MKNIVLAFAAAGAVALAVSATPASARVAGLNTPAVESNTVDVRRCHHHRWSSRWHCRRHWHHHHYHAQPFLYHPPHRWHHRRHRHHWHW